MKCKYDIVYNPTIKDFEDCYLIECDYLEPSTISSVDQVTKWDKKNNDIHVFVRDKECDKTVGEITILPLSKEQFDLFMNNMLEDTEINEDTLLSYKAGCECYLLFSAIAIDSKYRNDRIVLGLLIKGLYDKIKLLMDKGIIFLNMCSEGQTLDGQNFIENFLNLKYKRDTKDRYKLYYFDNKSDFDKWLNRLPEYIDSYFKKFNLDEVL